MITHEEAKLHAAHYMWRDCDISYKLDALQQEILETVTSLEAKKVCILSSRQIGKSYWGCVFALMFLLRNPNKIARIVAPTLKQCSDIVQDNLLRIILDAPPEFIVNRKSEYRWQLHNGSSLRLGALERANVDGNRGGNASLVIYEECGFVKAEEFLYGVNSVLGPQLLRSKGMEIYVTSPSEDPDHPLHTMVLPECEELGTAFRYTVYDSPSITPDMIDEAARRCGGTDTEAFQREYMAKIIRPATLMVTPAFNPMFHVEMFREPLECIWSVTIDWGGVRDLTVALLHTYDYLSDTDIIFDEKRWPVNTDTSVIVPDLMEWEAKYPIQTRWADVSGQLQVELSSKYPVNIPQKSDWKASVNSMAVKFSSNKIKIHPRCQFLIKSARAGMFNKTRTDFERTPELGHCDALAALMYAIRSQDRSNPYERESANRDHVVFSTRKQDPTLGEALNPKRFGSFK